jgi:DNA-directed RNA polymerase sigma subunit (sigma70/sigma32)
MAKNIRLNPLTKSEQIELWRDFKPLKDKLRALIGKDFRGGWKKLNLLEARKRIPDTPEIKRAQRAMEKLVAHNTGMVAREVHRRWRHHKIANADDLLQAGKIGLIYALYLYDPFHDGKEIKFSSYAFSWIKALIDEELHGDRTIKPPTSERKYQFAFITSIKGGDGEIMDIFDMLDDERADLLSKQVEDALTPAEYTAFTQEPLEAMLELGVNYNQLEQIKESAKQRILDAIA